MTMIFAAYFSANLLFLLFFIWVPPKKLHMFEIIFLWIIITFFYQSIFASLTINLHWIEISTVLGSYWALVVNRLLIIPLFIIWLMDRIWRQTGVMAKIAYVALAVLSLTGMQTIAVRIGLIRPVQWHGWMTAATWLALILLAMALLKVFQSCFKKEFESR